MSYAPCQNPNCHSYGKPHPNCRCYDGMAEGGEAGTYCSEARAHKKECQYFVDGGEVEEPDFIPSPAATPIAAATDEGPDFIPSHQDDEPDFIPSEDNSALAPADLQKKIYNKSHPNGPMPAEAPEQLATSLVEGVGSTALGPAFPFLAHNVLGVPYEDMAEREQTNPGIHALGEVLGTPISPLVKGVGLLGKGMAKIGNVANVAIDFAEMSKLGQTAIKGATELMGLHAADAETKAILGTGNPADAAASFSALGSVGVLGALLSTSGSLAGELAAKALEKAAVPMARKAEMALSGLGAAQRGDPLESLLSSLNPKDAKALTTGYNAYANLPQRIGTLSTEISKLHGMKEGGLMAAGIDYAMAKLANMFLEPAVGKARDVASKYTVPAVTRWLGSGARGSINSVTNYVEKVAKGQSKVNNALDQIFKVGTQQAWGFGHDEKKVESLRKWVDRGGMIPHIDDAAKGEAPQGLAKGGEVKAKPIGGIHTDDLHETMPEQAALISAARGRISNYLLAQRPRPQVTALAYDRAPDQGEAKKNYRRALEIGAAPLSIMKKISDGSLLPRDIQHAEAMYPELMGSLRQKATDRIMQDQVDGKKMPYKSRQSLSLFIGAPLSSDLTPQMIQAAQSVFVQKKQDQQMPQASAQGGASKGSKQSLSKSDRSYLTSEQAREQRQQKV